MKLLILASALSTFTIPSFNPPMTIIAASCTITGVQQLKLINPAVYLAVGGKIVCTNGGIFKNGFEKS